MWDVTLPAPGRIVELDRDRFAAACADLFRRAAGDRRPDALVAIPTGGLFVAKAMVSTAGEIPILPLTCRRPTTSSWARSMAVRGVAAALPRAALDRLRVLEHAVLTRRAKATKPDRHEFSEAELNALRLWLATAGDSPSLLVVDDAVDSGTTLSRVLRALRELSLPGADIRSAVISVTTERPRVQPTYALYHRQLCRFPWSLDAPSDPRS